MNDPTFADPGVPARPIPPDVLAVVHAELRVSKMATADLFGLRALLVKYSEDEARDDHGRWTASASLLEAVSNWGDTSDYIRSGILSGHPDGDGKQLLAALAQQPAAAPELTRGIRLEPEDYGFLNVHPGDTIDLNLSSWSADRAIAADFATGMPDEVPVMMTLAGGSQALDVSSLMSQLPGGDWMHQQEWLTGGRFEVVARDPAAMPTGQLGVNLVLKQTLTLVDDPAGRTAKGA